MEWYEWLLVIGALALWPIAVAAVMLLLFRRSARRDAARAEIERAQTALARRNGWHDRGRVSGRRPEHVDEQPGRNGTMRVYGTATLPGDKPATRK